ncbi:MAG TPA: fatty acid--CoA ligase family protein, partial [Polyangiaceae bacterium]|nr:fatty acid--CoA ligase family protein [Polyangiaceae bacterium]
ALLALPLAHVGGLTMLTRAVAHRSTLVLFEPERSLLAELDAFAATAEKHAVTLISLVPTLLARLLERSWRPPPSLRAVVLGGAPIPADLVRRARAAHIPVVPTYGLTETCASAASGPYRDRLTPPRPHGEILPSGVPLAGIELRIREGTIEVRGDTLFSGYAGDPASDPGRDWLATHDRGYLDENGELVVNGRTSDLIITGGENVDPAEVEAALGSVPGVELACVLGEPDPTFGETVTALLVVEPGGPRSVSALAELLGDRLAAYKRPRRVQIVRELPLTASGKIDRRAARRLKDEKPDL